MHDSYLISDVHLTPRVPTNGVVALQCNLFTVAPWEPTCQITVWTRYVFINVIHS